MANCDERVVACIRKLLIEHPSEELLKVFTQSFLNHIQESVNLKGTINIRMSPGSPSGSPSSQVKHYSFFGYPDCDYIIQVSVVLSLWNKSAQFPIKFKKLEGFTDESRQYIDQQLQQMTPLVHDIF